MEMTEQHAKDIDEMLTLVVERGFPNAFDVSWYQREKRPDWDRNYLYFLVGLINRYMNKRERKWVTVDHNRQLTCNAHTKAFMEGGGFRRIYEEEFQEEQKRTIEYELARRTLKDYGRTRFVAWAGLIVAIIVAVIELIGLIKGK